MCDLRCTYACMLVGSRREVSCNKKLNKTKKTGIEEILQSEGSLHFGGCKSFHWRSDTGVLSAWINLTPRGLSK